MSNILHNIYYPTFLLKKPSISAVLFYCVKSIMGKKYDAYIYGYITRCLNLDICLVEGKIRIINFKLESFKDEYLDYRIEDILSKI